jgi:hypothetical protein
MTNVSMRNDEVALVKIKKMLTSPTIVLPCIKVNESSKLKVACRTTSLQLNEGIKEKKRSTKNCDHEVELLNT